MIGGSRVSPDVTTNPPTSRFTAWKTARPVLLRTVFVFAAVPERNSESIRFDPSRIQFPTAVCACSGATSAAHDVDTIANAATADMNLTINFFMLFLLAFKRAKSVTGNQRMSPISLIADSINSTLPAGSREKWNHSER